MGAESHRNRRLSAPIVEQAYPTYAHIHTCVPGGNHAAKPMGNAIHKSHRSHTDNSGHRRESRSEINSEVVFQDPGSGCSRRESRCVPGGNRAAKSMGNAIHKSHRNHTDNSGHRREWRSEIDSEVCFQDPGHDTFV